MNKHTGSMLDSFLRECGVGPLNKCCIETMELCEKRFALAFEKHTTPPIVFTYEEQIATLQTRLDNALEFVFYSSCQHGGSRVDGEGYVITHRDNCLRCATLKRDEELKTKGEE